MAFKMLDFEEKERVLAAAGPDLLEMLDTSPLTMARLVSAQVISHVQSEDIRALSEPSAGIAQLLAHLRRGSILQFVRFCIVLHDKAERGDIVRDVLKLEIQRLRWQEQMEIQKEPESPAGTRRQDRTFRVPTQDLDPDPVAITRQDPSPGIDQSPWGFKRSRICCQNPASGRPPPGGAALDLGELPPQDASTSTTAHKETTHYCSFVLADKFDIGTSDVESPEYIQFVTDKEDRIVAALRERTKKTTKVRVTAVSERKQMLFVSITCPCGLSDVQITQALMSRRNKLSKKSLHIVSGTLHFMDAISASLAADIVRKSHVNDKYGRKIDFDTQYVRLKMLDKQEMSTVDRDELEQPDKYQARLQRSHSKHIEDEEILAPGGKRKFVVIRGRAGIGKTTVVHCFMWKWAHGDLARQFKAIFLLNLRVLMAVTTELTLPDLLRRFPVFKVGRHCSALDATWLQDNAESIAFVMDGLDEAFNFRELWHREYKTTSMDEEAGALHWGMAILKRVQLETSTVLVTSRPFAALSCIEPTMLVEVMGLTRERVMIFVERNVSAERIPMVKQTLHKSPILLSIATVTFYCAALCKVLQEDIDVTDQLTTYTHITAYIIEMFTKHSVKKAARSEVLKAASSSIRSLCRMAYAGLVKRTERGIAQLVFDKDDYQRQNLQKEDVDVARETGLFIQTEVSNSTKPDNNQVLGEFVHLSVQEFLAMAGVLIRKAEDVKKTVEMLSTSGQFNMSLLFLYGLVFDKANRTVETVRQTLGVDGENTEGLATLLKDSIQNVSDDLQLLQIVHESQSPEIARQVGERRFREEVKFNETNLTVVDILAVTFLLKHNPSTASIEISNTGLDAICVKELARGLQDNNSVKRLWLIDEDLDDECSQYLADMLKVNRALTELVERVTDTGVGHLASALRSNMTLKQLEINSDSMKDTGVGHLATALQSNKTLERLEIYSHNVTDTGVGHLATALRSNRTLEELTWLSSPVGEEGAAALVEALKVNTTVDIIIMGTKEVERQLQHHHRIKVHVNPVF